MFLALFLRMLKTGGRCACIVPDGVLFGSSKAHQSIRKELIENHQLRAVISMPSGVFKPYAGVSTAVLVFTKTGAGGTDKVWFYDMKADGFSLDDKRTEVKENDIPDIIARFHNLETLKLTASAPSRAFLCPKKKLPPMGTIYPSISTRRPSMCRWSTLRPRRSLLTCMSWKWRSPRVWQSWRRWCDGEVGKVCIQITDGSHNPPSGVEQSGVPDAERSF